MTQQIDVFISYKREEQPLAEQIANALKASGYSQTSDLNLKTSEHFGDAIDRMIRAAKLVLVLWTPESAKSDWAKSEARLGAELGTYLGSGFITKR
ncbi:MAG: toll/interleukin-1 receptor domain-containing protein [Paracoccaceae bacterium]